MKTLAALVLTLILSASLHAGDKHLFILSGQSNMRGLNPKVSFTPTVEAEFGKENVIVVKDAQGGQPIRRWYKKWKSPAGTHTEETGDLYDRLMKKVNIAIDGKNIESVTFIWMQGESDSRNNWCSVYEASMKGLIQQLKNDMKLNELNVVIGRISDCRMSNPEWIKVREVQVKVTADDPHAVWVDTDDLNDVVKDGKKGNGLHYTPEGYKILGQRFATEAIELINKN